jgi:hypothetical protein
MTLEKIIQFLAELIKKEFTGRIIFDFHEGKISHKVKKEIVEVVE